ncbi:MAG: hypothetical protein RR444_04660 [Oscillospiraceae bacterium]
MKVTLRYIPIFISVLITAMVFKLLFCKLNYYTDFANTLSSSREYILTVAGLLSGIIMAYLTSKVLQIREERISKLPQINELTQKIHRFRSIINKLLSSNLLPKNARNIVDTKYKGLTFFDYRENTFVNSKTTQQSKDYINDSGCGGLSNLYLELRAFVPKNHAFDETLYSEFEVSKFYDTQLLEKWVKYDCGNGLWYYFENEYAVYRGRFDFNIYDGHRKEILESCSQIDKERYQDIPFDAQLLAKLGNQMYSDIIPKLFKTQLSIEKGLPKIVNYLFAIFVLLVVFGIVIPIFSNIFNLSSLWDIISISTTTGICAYIIFSFYGFMKQEIKIGKIVEI